VSLIGVNPSWRAYSTAWGLRRLGGCLDYARLMQDAGADALELNVYQLATDPDESGDSIEALRFE